MFAPLCTTLRASVSPGSRRNPCAPQTAPIFGGLPRAPAPSPLFQEKLGPCYANSLLQLLGTNVALCGRQPTQGARRPSARAAWGLWAPSTSKRRSWVSTHSRRPGLDRGNIRVCFDWRITWGWVGKTGVPVHRKQRDAQGKHWALL